MPVSTPVFDLHLKKDVISATAGEIDGEFTVLEDSGASMAWTGVEHAYKVLREKLIREGVIVPGNDGRTMRFTRDRVFASPSAAGRHRARPDRERVQRLEDPRFGDQLRRLASAGY